MNHNKPMLGNYVGRRGKQVMVHIVDGPTNKKGMNVWFDAKHLLPHKVSSLALRADFKAGKTPEEITQNNGAYVVTDSDHNNYPDFTKPESQISLDGSVRDSGETAQIRAAKEKLGLGSTPEKDDSDPVAKLKASWGVGSSKPSFGGEDPNMTIVRDFLKSGRDSRSGSEGPSMGKRREKEARSVPMTLGLRRKGI